MHTDRGARTNRRVEGRVGRLSPPDYRRRSPLARPFHGRAVRWRRDGVSGETAALDGGIIVLRRFRFPSRSAALSGRRIFFLSDLHFHGGAAQARRIAALRQAVADIHPDLLLLGGDAVGDSCAIAQLSGVLRDLSAPAVEALAVPGNWERGKRWLDIGVWKDIYSRGGFRLLCNEHVSCSGIGVYGCDDLVHGDPLPPGEPPSSDDGFRILLAHRPDAAVAFDDRGGLAPFDLVLCGHTHGGQWRLPGAGALYVPGFYHRRFDRGWFRHCELPLRMLVSSGCGELSLPGRFNCRREAVLIELV